MIKSISKVSVGTTLSRIFGLIRDIATTNLLGASFLHDIFVITFKIPNLFRRFFAEGAFIQSFVPIYNKVNRDNTDEETKEFINIIAGNLLVGLFIFTVLVLIFTPIFILFFAPGFYFDDSKRIIAVDILRIMFPYTALISLVAFSGGIQNSHNKFFIPAYTPIIFNLVLIISATIIAPLYDVPIYALAWGVLLAGFFQLIIQLFPLSAISRIPKPKINFKHKLVRKVFILMIPAIFAGGITQINILVDTIYASLLSSGSATWLYVSDRLIQFPLGIFAIAIGTVLLPTLSKLDISKDLNTFYKTIQNSINLVLLIAIPSLIALIVCANDFIMTLFYRGEFKIFDVLMASKSLVLLSAGIPFFMLMKILIPIFFSQEDTATPMKIAGISLVMNIFLNYFFAIKLGYGHVGLALSSTITAVISVFLAFYLLNKRMLLPRINFLNPFYFSLIISSFILAIFLMYFSKIIDFESLNQFKRFAFVIIEIFIGIFIYFSVIRITLGNSLRSYIK